MREKHIEDYGENTQIEQDTLSDGSVAYNVIFRGGANLRFGCVSERAAHDLADHLERAAWIEVL